MKAPHLRSGVLLIDKPSGITSAEALNQLKKRWKFSRIGHGGTLDPFATGLLVVLLGEATKAARFLLEGEKEYEAESRLGIETDSGDLTGNEIATSAIPQLNLEEWQNLANKFLGRQKQTPPAFSAIKVKGKALYEYARKGEVVEVKEREVQILNFSLKDISANSLFFSVRCSGGTYIRVLGSDLAKMAGAKSHLISLRRTASSSFRINSAISLQDALAPEQADLPILPVTQCLSHLPQINCEFGIAEKVRQGNLAAFERLRPQLEKPGYFLLLSENRPVAICNHNPMMVPFCSIERVFDPNLVEPV